MVSVLPNVPLMPRPAKRPRLLRSLLNRRLLLSKSIRLPNPLRLVVRHLLQSQRPSKKSMKKPPKKPPKSALKRLLLRHLSGALHVLCQHNLLPRLRQLVQELFVAQRPPLLRLPSNRLMTRTYLFNSATYNPSRPLGGLFY